MIKKLLIASGCCLFLAAIAGKAKADTIGPNCGGGNCLGSTYSLSYSTTGTANVFDIFLTVDTSATTLTPGSDFLQDVALKVSSDFTSTPTLLSSPSSYGATQAGGLNASGCDGSGSGFFCNAYTGIGEGLAIGPGDIYTWEWQIETADLFTGNNGASIKVQYVDLSGKNAGITSADATDSPVVPEPSTLLMLGTGLALLAGMLKMRQYAPAKFHRVA